MPEPHQSQHEGYISNFIETREPKIIGENRNVMALMKDGRETPINLNVSEVSYLTPRQK